MKGAVCPACGAPWHGPICPPPSRVDPLSWRLLCAGVHLLLIVTALVIGPAVLG